MLVSTTVLKFSTGTSGSSNGDLVGLGQTNSLCPSSEVLSNTPLPWESDKFSPVKLESPDTNLDDILLNHSASNDFAELKPLPFDDYGSSTGLSGGMDPVLSNHSNLNNNNLLGTKCLNTSIQFTPPCSQSDVTSSGSPTSPSGSSIVTKIETLDFSKNDLDDLASIVGISIDADSTVPNGCSGDISDLGDLDWIDSIKPLNCDINIESLMSSTHNMSTNLILHRNSSIVNSPMIGLNQPYLQMVPVGTTLQTLLQSGVTNVTHQMPKITQLQQRPLQVLKQQQQQHPPPYSILQNRLQQGSLSVNQQYSMIKVDSTYDLLKSQDDNNLATTGYLSSSYNSPDSLPHSTQTPLNQVSTSDQGLQRRLNELGGLTKIKKKQAGSNVRPKMSSGLDGSSPIDSKKMMHHCQICNRGFLNKSNIKVHMRTHTGEKPFKCEHCSKAFRQKAHLLKHLSIHKRITRD